MKAITKKISLLLMLSAVLFLSSCLDSGSNSYIGNEEYSYITSSQTSGTVYARTLAGYLITSPKIQQLTPGTAAFLTYQVTEETPTVALEDNMIAYKVNLGGEPIIIDQTVLQMTTAPDVPAVNFESIMDPLYAQNQLFGDLWLFPYTYKIKKGERVTVQFYKANAEESEQSSQNDVLIDVRLTKTGTPEANATDKVEGDYVVANMSSLRMMMADKADANGNLNIKFRYYRADHEGLYTSSKTYTIIIDKK